VNGGVYVSKDSCASWTAINSGKMNTSTVVWDVAIMGTGIFAATDTNGILTTSDGGKNWTSMNNGLQILGVSAIVVHGTKLIAGTGRGVSLSTNSGASWATYNNGFAGRAGHA